MTKEAGIVSQQAKSYGLLIIISLLWGAQFLFNDLALASMAPAMVATLRAVIAALTLSLVTLFSGMFTNQQGRYYYIMIFILGFFEATLPFFLIVWGQQHINSSITAIIMGMIPVLTVGLASLFVKDEQIHLGKILSIIIGFAGLLCLLGPQLWREASGFWQHIIGELAVLAGASSFALSLILVKKMNFRAPVFAARDIFIAASLQMMVACVLLRVPVPHHLLWSSVLAVLMLGIFCAGVVYTLYVILIGMAGPTFASLTNYLVPLVGVLLGVSLLGDALQWYQVLALLLIISAVAANELKRR